MSEEKPLLPLEMRIEQARSELVCGINNVCAKYNLPGSVLDLIIESVLAEEHRQRLAQICNCINVSNEEKENDKKDAN